LTKLAELERSVQAVLFAAGEPYEKERLAKLLEIDIEMLSQLVERINEFYQKTPFAILELDQSYQMVTRAEYAAIIRQALEVKNNAPLSQAALEVLAIIAYNQPVTKSFIEQVRGVDSSSVVNSLVSKGLVEEQGRLEIPGRPLSYGTTEHFLRCFGMKSIEALPKIPQSQEESVES
jgi:segregation and condensation protein B